MRLELTIRVVAALAAGALSMACAAQTQESGTQPLSVDRVVAVVNNRAILASDVEKELHVSALEPERGAEQNPDPRSALTRLIRRTLIQQQIRREEEQAAVPTEEQVQARLTDLRKQLPACVRAHCITQQGWNAFLASHNLTAEQADGYMRLRLEILNFIENRFRQGIRIPEEDVEKYYRETLLPQYPAGQQVPALESVAPRIQEILLQQQVTNLFSAWLENLRKQGDVEVLDPGLEQSAPSQAGDGGSQ